MLVQRQNEHRSMAWDVFICHASEDKEAIARPLALALKKHQLAVWFDEFTLRMGDSLRRSIDRGLSESRFGVVVLSPAFFSKNWPQYELDGLLQRELCGQKTILPVWHEVDVAQVLQYSPPLADKVASRSADGLHRVVAAILAALDPVNQPVSVSINPKAERRRLDLLRDNPNIKPNSSDR